MKYLHNRTIQIDKSLRKHGFNLVTIWEHEFDRNKEMRYIVFIDDLVKLIDTANIGCKTGGSCTSIFLYADDIILLAPSAQALQSLVNICELELKRLWQLMPANLPACGLAPGTKVLVLM